MIISELQTSCQTPDVIQPAHHLFNLLFICSLLPVYFCSLFFSMTMPRIRQAKVQILPERILPDPLSAVQLTPLSRLHIQSSSKPPNQSCKQAQCCWNKYQQVRHTNSYKQHICAAVTCSWKDMNLKIMTLISGDYFVGKHQQIKLNHSPNYVQPTVKCQPTVLNPKIFSLLECKSRKSSNMLYLSTWTHQYF